MFGWDGIQALLAGDAICKNDGVNVVRIMRIQANICAAAIQSKTYGGGSMMGNIGMGTGIAGRVIRSQETLNLTCVKLEIGVIRSQETLTLTRAKLKVGRVLRSQEKERKLPKSFNH